MCGLSPRFSWMTRIAGSPKMAYKSQFVPHQVLVGGHWQTGMSASSAR